MISIVASFTKKTNKLFFFCINGFISCICIYICILSRCYLYLVEWTFIGLAKEIYSLLHPSTASSAVFAFKFPLKYRLTLHQLQQLNSIEGRKSISCTYNVTQHEHLSIEEEKFHFKIWAESRFTI